MEPVSYLALVAGYLGLHLLGYFVFFRNVPAFSREGVIFAYHGASVLGVTVITLIVALREPYPVALFVAVVALHGIYSTSFLEFWSLAEGGYSLTILRAIDRAAQDGSSVDLHGLQRIGLGKRESRLASLVRLGLVRCEDERLLLTGRGRLVAGALRAIAWPANLSEAR